MIKIQKRDNRIECIQKEKIFKALKGATNGKSIYDNRTLQNIASNIIYNIINKYDYNELEEILLDVNTVHDEVISGIKEFANNKSSKDEKELYLKLADNYSSYRQDRDKARMRNTSLMKTVSAIGIKTDRDNGNRL